MVYAAAFFMEEALQGDLFRFPGVEMRLMEIKSIGKAFLTVLTWNRWPVPGR
jgi:hypothetical protein